MEFVLGNTFAAVFFGVYGGYCLAYGTTIVPYFGSYAAYSPDPSQPQLGVSTPEFNFGLAFWNLMMGLFTVYCTICALWTNLIFFLAFFFLTLTFILVAAAEWVAFEAGGLQTGANLKLVGPRPRSSLVLDPLLTPNYAGGACGFVVMVFGWYLLLALMLTTVDFPINLPVFDLSQIVPSGQDLAKKRKKQMDLEKGQ